jgi:tRNA(Glu) U13 pseudouridine synthase TruD
MPWKIKQKPEDFVVTEVIFDRTEESWKEKMRRIRGQPAEKKDRYLWFTLRKKDVDFFHAMGALGRALKISTKDLGYAGTKDRAAVTYQTISVPAGKEDAVKALDAEGLEATDFRYRNRPIKLGEHKGNDFRITVRNVNPEDRERIDRGIARMKTEGFVNYFGEQRFGSVSGINAAIGKFLVLGDIESAAKAMILECGGEYEKRMSAYLKRKPGDYEGALMQMPLRLLKLFVHAYQAKIWNECAVRYDGENTPIPIVGHRTDVRDYPRVRGILGGVLHEEKIQPEDFKNHKFRELSSRGSDRNYMVVPKGLEHSFGRDELNRGKKKLKLLFFLPKGSYATELVRQLEEA